MPTTNEYVHAKMASVIEELHELQRKTIQHYDQRMRHLEATVEHLQEQVEDIQRNQR